jgi:hypothetical protein
MATLKWKAANLYSTTNSTETNSTSILPTSAVTYALAQSINEMGGSGMLYFSSATLSATYTASSSSVSAAKLTFTGTIDIPDGYSKVCFIYNTYTFANNSNSYTPKLYYIKIDENNNVTACAYVGIITSNTTYTMTIYYLLQ